MQEKRRKGKKVSESRVVLAQVMHREEANSSGNIHGGAIMKLIDTAAGVSALRHASANVVTTAIDRIDFHHPVFIGETSMEVGVRVGSENPLTGEKKHTGSEYLTYVALDRNNWPIVLSPLILEKNQDIHRSKETQERRQMRLAESKKEKQSR